MNYPPPQRSSYELYRSAPFDYPLGFMNIMTLFHSLSDFQVYKCTDSYYFPYMGSIPIANNEKTSHFSDLIVQIAENGNREAFIELFNYYAPRIKAYAIKNGSSANESEDLAQETLITVWNKAKLFDKNKSAASTWIYSIGRNKRIDYLRKHKHPLPELDEQFYEAENSSQEELVENEEIYKIVRKELNSLPSEQSQVLKMSFFDGTSHGQISNDLSIPLGTVKSRIRLAVNNIRKKMKDLQ